MDENEKTIHSPKTKIAYLETLRVLSAFGVITLHICCNLIKFYDEGLSETEHRIFEFLWFSFHFCVPVFVMITGAIFLSPEKEVGYKKILSKYLPRMLFILLLFGFAFCWMEIVFNERKITIPQIPVAFLNLVVGYCWDNMWYLYMLCGLYLAIPIVKAFVEKASDKDILIFLTVLFLFESVQSFSKECFGFKTGFYIPFSGIYIFYLIAGHFLSKIEIKNMFFTLGLIFVPLSVLVFFIALGYEYSVLGKYFSYSSPITVCLSLGIFSLFRNSRVKKPIEDFCLKFGKYTFGIYIFHVVFLNFAYKFLHFTPINYPALLVFFVLFFATPILSFALSLLFRKLPFFKNLF